MLKLDCADARQVHKTNNHSIWSALATETARSDDEAIFRLREGIVPLHIAPTFRIARDEPIFAMGSCFAREVERALVALDFDVASLDMDLFAHPLLAAAARQPVREGARLEFGFLNRYNTMSLLGELAHLLGRDRDIESGALLYDLGADKSADLHYSQSLVQVGRIDALERRRLVRERQGHAIRRCRTFVFTLGMAEAWFDRKAGRYLNNTPGPRVMAAYGDRFEVRLTEYEEHARALEAIHALLSEEIGGDIKIVITVSPVPLQRTFLPGDIIITNSYAKSMLRAAAQQFATRHGNVDYFPSYEIVQMSDPDIAWAGDRRHVRPAMVASIMETFRVNYTTD